MSISAQNLRGITTKAYMKAYMENIPAPSHFKTFFGEFKTSALDVHLEVKRGTERIAVDVIRGTEGKRYTSSLSSEKGFRPPFFKNFLEMTSMDRYNRTFGSPAEATPETVGYLAKDVGSDISEMRATIERAEEKMRVAALETGIITLADGSQIDFKRKAGSVVDVSAANPWSTATTDIESQLIAVGDFFRKTGKNPSKMIDATMSGESWVDLKNSNYFDKNAGWQNVNLNDIKVPQANGVGSSYMGRITAGSYKFDIWVYDEVYEAADTGTVTRYTDETKVIFTPQKGTVFTMTYAGVPALMGRNKGRFFKNVAQKYYIWDTVDEDKSSHRVYIQSAPLPILTTVDMVYTLKVNV